MSYHYNADGRCGSKNNTLEFNPGPPTNPRRVNVYGHFPRGRWWKWLRKHRFGK